MPTLHVITLLSLRTHQRSSQSKRRGGYVKPVLLALPPMFSRTTLSCQWYFDEMTHMGLRPNRYTYGALLQACGRAQQPDLAWHYFERLLAEGVELHKFLFDWLERSLGTDGFASFCEEHQLDPSSWRHSGSNPSDSRAPVVRGKQGDMPVRSGRQRPGGYQHGGQSEGPSGRQRQGGSGQGKRGSRRGKEKSRGGKTRGVDDESQPEVASTQSMRGGGKGGKVGKGSNTETSRAASTAPTQQTLNVPQESSGMQNDMPKASAHMQVPAQFPTFPTTTVPATDVTSLASFPRAQSTPVAENGLDSSSVQSDTAVNATIWRRRSDKGTKSGPSDAVTAALSGLTLRDTSSKPHMRENVGLASFLK